MPNRGEDKFFTLRFVTRYIIEFKVGEETQISDERDACMTSLLSIRYSLAFKSAAAGAGPQSRTNNERSNTTTLLFFITTREHRYRPDVAPLLEVPGLEISTSRAAPQEPSRRGIGRL